MGYYDPRHQVEMIWSFYSQQANVFLDTETQNNTEMWWKWCGRHRCASKGSKACGGEIWPRIHWTRIHSGRQWCWFENTERAECCEILSNELLKPQIQIVKHKAPRMWVHTTGKDGLQAQQRFVLFYFYRNIVCRTHFNIVHPKLFTYSLSK